MPVELTVSGGEIAAKYLAEIGKGLPVAMARAANRAADAARTYSRRALTAEIGLAAKYGARALTVFPKATPDNLVATVRARGFRLPLIAYTGTSGFRSGKGIAGRTYRTGTVPAGAFFAQVPSGHRGIFKRSGRFGRRGKPYLERIQQVTGPSVPELVVAQDIFDRAGERALEVFRERLDHEVDRLRAGRA